MGDFFFLITIIVVKFCFSVKKKPEGQTHLCKVTLMHSDPLHVAAITAYSLAPHMALTGEGSGTQMEPTAHFRSRLQPHQLSQLQLG